jgi:hypothetical protein
MANASGAPIDGRIRSRHAAAMNTRARMLRFSLIGIVVLTVAFFAIRSAQTPASAPALDRRPAPAHSSAP